MDVPLWNFIAPFYGWGSTASWLEPLRGGSLLFTTSSQKSLVFILSTSEGWTAESTLEPPSGFEHGTAGLEIEHLNHWERCHWCCSGVFTTDFDKILYFVLMFPLLTLNKVNAGWKSISIMSWKVLCFFVFVSSQQKLTYWDLLLIFFLVFKVLVNKCKYKY